LEPSRLLPTAMDAVIDSEDALLLQFIYCNAKRLENRFYLLITALASNYGLSISHPTLRHAAIALAAADLSERRFKEKSKEHQQKTFSALRSMLASPHLLCELDLFAAIVLGTLAVWENNPAEVLVHSRGCLAILSHFCRNSIESRASNALRVFRPFFIDALDRLLRFTNDLDLIQLTLAIRVKFSQRVEYYQVLYPREAVYMAASMICKRTLYDFIAAVRSAINVTAVGKLVDKNAFVQLLNRAKAELNDPEFRQALDLHYERQKTHQYQDPQYVEQYLNCIHMLMVLLEAPTIWQGRHDPIAKSLAIKIISYYRSLQLPRGRVTNTIGVWHLYIEFLMRGGFVLHPKATPECMCLFAMATWGIS